LCDWPAITDDRAKYQVSTQAWTCRIQPEPNPGLSPSMFSAITVRSGITVVVLELSRATCGSKKMRCLSVHPASEY
jgi:hypothetical protein